MSSQRFTLDKLNVDILYIILLFLRGVSRRSLFSMLYANRALHNATLPVLHRSCVLHYEAGDRQAATLAQVESWLKDSPEAAIFSIMRDITVKNSVYYRRCRSRRELDETSNKWDSLNELLIRIPRLTSFTFDCPEQIPIIILNTLHSHHPTTHLHIRNWTRTAEDRVCGDPVEEVLAISPCLRSLHGYFITGGSSDADYRLAAFDRIVKLSPHLESISQTSRHADSGDGYAFTLEERDIRNAEMRKFEVDKPRRKAIKSLEMDSGNAVVLKNLSTYIALDQLATLKSGWLTSDFMFVAAEDSAFRLSSLKHLDVKLREETWVEDRKNAQNKLITAFKVFLSSLSPLQTLSAVLDTSRPWSSILSTILLHHSASLETLSLHQVESAPKRSMRVCLTLEEVNNICNNCPKLTSFALDIDRTLDMEQERAYYDILRQSINLRELTVHMDLGLAYHAASRQLISESLNQSIPDDDRVIIRQRQRMECYQKADEAFAREVWEEVSQKGSSRKGVQLLILCMGEQNRERGRGKPAFWVQAERMRRQRVTVQRNERDDQLELVDVTIKGPMLTHSYGLCILP
ncbi:hypothetical protein GYMLUDRAFT_255719 [Collybiopsis luxurians FD-317 M1]|nr:hypothetical protein GYMLUDRAFT_255719 [Collybiopsis luxurians FD-317 M1]